MESFTSENNIRARSNYKTTVKHIWWRREREERIQVFFYGRVLHTYIPSSKKWEREAGAENVNNANMKSALSSFVFLNLTTSHQSERPLEKQLARQISHCLTTTIECPEIFLYLRVHVEFEWWWECDEQQMV